MIVGSKLRGGKLIRTWKIYKAVCRCCKIEFESNTKAVKFCCRSCYLKGEEHILKCVMCGKEYYHYGRVTNKTCGQECRNELFNESRNKRDGIPPRNPELTELNDKIIIQDAERKKIIEEIELFQQQETDKVLTEKWKAEKSKIKHGKIK